MPFAATWMELETLILSDVSQKEKDKYHMISVISGISYYSTKEPFHRRKSWTWRIDLWLPSREGREWEGVGAWGKYMQNVALGMD